MKPDSKRAPWEKLLLRGKEGIKRLVHNIIVVLTNAPEWRRSISWDEFAERIVIVEQCPAGPLGPWRDVSDIRTAAWLQQSRWGLEVSPAMVAEAVNAVAAANSVHPLRARLRSLKWDGVARVDTWTTRYLGAEDTEVHREFGRRWLLGAVSRAFEPGSQVDTMLILEGPQGRGKSSALRALSLGFFTDELGDVGNKDATMQLHGAWIVEIAELDAISRADAAKVKAFLTRRTDRYRSPYGRRVEEHPRQCVFAGSVNHNDYLRDETGGRRFMPVACGEIQLDALKADAEQLWAEALARYGRGEATWTRDERLQEEIRHHTSVRYTSDVWHNSVASYAESLRNVSVAECLSQLGLDIAKWNQNDANRVAKILKSIGFTRKQVVLGGRRQWRYFAPDTTRYDPRKPVSGSNATQRNDDANTTSPVTPVENENVYVNTPIPLIENGGAAGESGEVDDEPGGGCFGDLLD